MARPVFPGGDIAFKINVIERMIFYEYRQSFFTWFSWRVFWNRPGFQNAFHLQPEIEMVMRGIMLMYYKARFHDNWARVLFLDIFHFFIQRLP